MSTKEIDHSDRVHYEFGGSNCERNYHCPGALALSQGIPDRETSKAAEEGTYFHELLDTCGIIWADTYNKTGKLLPVQQLLSFDTVDNWPSVMQYHAATWFEHLTEAILRLKPTKIFSEREVLFQGLDFPMGGTADFFFAYKMPKQEGLGLYIADAKYGAGKLVEAETMQLLFYACATASQFSKKHKFKHITGAIFQPRLADEEGEFWREVEYDEEQLYTWVEQLKESAIGSLALKNLALGVFDLETDPEAREKLGNWLDREGKLTAGSWCGFCKANVECPAFVKAANDKAAIDFADVEFEEKEAIRSAGGFVADVTPEEIARKLVWRLDTPEKLGKFLDFIPIFKAFIKSAQDHAIVTLLEGGEVPGWKVVEGRSQRRFPKEKQVEVAQTLIKLGVTDPYERKLKGIGAVEKALKEATGKKPKDIRNLLDPLVERTVPGKTLAPTEDNRHALTTDSVAASQFAGIEFDDD
jgi:hypothetical protein